MTSESSPSESPTGNGLRLAAATGLSVFAWVVFAVGVLSPLTPSEGYPSWPELVFFLGLPVLALLAIILLGYAWWLKLAALAELIFLGAVAYSVLSAVYQW